MLATSRREFFDVVLNAPTPQGWSAVDYTSSDDSSNPADELKSKNAAEDGFIASQKTTTNATSTKEQLEPQTPSSPDSADPRSSRPAAAASLVQQNTPHCLEQRNSEYKIASRSKFTFADGDTELNKTNRNALYGERALWRVGKLKRPKRRSKNSLRWKPAVNIGTQEGATSYDAGVIWLPVQESSSNQNTSASDARQPCPKAVYSSKQPQTELKTEETSASPKTNENPTSPPPDIKIKIEEVPENRSMSVPCGTRDKSKQKAGHWKYITSGEIGGSRNSPKGLHWNVVSQKDVASGEAFGTQRSPRNCTFKLSLPHRKSELALEQDSEAIRRKFAQRHSV